MSEKLLKPRASNNFGLKWYSGGCPYTKYKENGDRIHCKCEEGKCQSPQNICIRMQTNEKKVIAAVIDNRHSWAVINEKDLISITKENNAFMCELLSQYPKKVYFDIDGNEPDKLTLDKVKEIINKYFPDAKMAISGYESEKKKSYHIILYEYILEDSNDLLEMKKLVKLIKSNECKYFDCGVYEKNKQMKCINQSKPNENIQKIIEGKKEKNHFINSFFTGKEKKVKINLPEDMPQIEMKLNELPKLKEPLKLDKSFTKDDLLDSKKLLKMAPNGQEFNHQYTWRVALFCFHNGLSFDDFWEWAKKKDNSDERKNKWIKYHWTTISRTDDFKMTKAGFIRLLSFFYPELIDVENPDDIRTKEFISSLDLNDEKIDRISQNHFNTKEKAVIFNIGMGGGKTTQTVDYLKKSDKKFIWIAPLQALVMNTYERFKQNKMDVLNYLDCGSGKTKRININKADKLILEAESLNKIDDTKKYDVLVIDEMEKVLKNWDSETHITNHLDKNFENFKNLFINAKKIILLDAFTTTATTQFLEDLGINDYVIYGSNYKPPKKKLLENFGYENTIDKIAKELDLGKKLYVFHAYKSPAKNHHSIEGFKIKLLEKCKTKPKILIYHGDMDDKNKKTLYNVNEVWDQYDCILTTSSITVGVNYEGDNYDKIYLLISGCVNMARDIIQTSMRVRKTKEDIIEVFFFNRMDKVIYKKPEYYEKSNDPIYRNVIDNIALEKQANFMDVFYKFCKLANYDCSNIKKFIFNKSEKFINDTFESKMLIPYNKIDSIDEESAQCIERDSIYATNATQIDKFTLNKYYFDYKFFKLNEEDRAYVWDNRVSDYFKNIKDPLIDLIIKDNDVNSIHQLDFKNIQVSDETGDYILANYKILNKLKNQNQKIVKLINHVLKCEIIENVQETKKTKKTKYQISELGEELKNIHHRLLNYQTKISFNDIVILS